MDEALISFYRKLLKAGFEHAGSFKEPSIFLDSIGEKIAICTQSARHYIHLYIKIKDDTIEDIKYLCICDPSANVAVEILCSLVRGKTFEEVSLVTEDLFTRVIEGESEDLRKSAKGLLQLLNKGIERYLDEEALKEEAS